MLYYYALNLINKTEKIEIENSSNKKWEAFEYYGFIRTPHEICLKNYLKFSSNIYNLPVCVYVYMHYF